MSRTYRKNYRFFYKHDGVFYTTYHDKTIKGKAQHYEELDWKKFKGFLFAFYLHFNASRFYQEVTVCESENYSVQRPSDVKKMCRRADRRRSNHSVRNGGDGFVKSAYDPWDWD